MIHFHIASTETVGDSGVPMRGVIQLLLCGYACYHFRYIADGQAHYGKVGNLGTLDEAKRWAAGEDVPLMHWTVEEVK